MTSHIHLNAEWKRIQEKTFTRWCNEQLKIIEASIEDLSKDLSNGVILITLLEILSQKRIGRYNKKPRIHAQRMENVDMALDFITKTEKIRLVNIGKSVLLHVCFLHGQLCHFVFVLGSGDIVEGNLKLILGLIWTLILHYQISLGLGLGLDENSKDNKRTSAKQALLGYIRVRLRYCYSQKLAELSMVKK